MRKTPLLLAAAAVLGLALAGGAVSAHQAGKSRFFDKLDQNQDGAISRDEMRAAKARYFAKLDSNGDGTISREEFLARTERHFARMDLNGDGQITPEEMQEARRRHHQERKAD